MDGQHGGVYVSERHKRIVLPWEGRFKSLVKEENTFEANGKRLFQLPHNDGTAKLLFNLGIEVDAPILRYYDFKHMEPFEAQRDALRLFTLNPRAYNLSGMGVGKTLSALWAFDWMRQHGRVNNMLVVCPLSTMTMVWERETFRNLVHLEPVVLYGDKAKRLKLLAGPGNVFILNHDGVRVKELAEELRRRNDIDLVVIDELSAFRERRTDRWKALNKIVQSKPYCWGLTGTPTPNGPTDAFAQCKLITPASVPDYYSRFQDQTTIKVSQFTRIPKREANDVVNKAMRPSVRWKLEDCVDIPDTVYSYRAAEMTAAQKAAYKKMMTALRVDFANGKVTAANAGVQLFKLLQIGLGFLYDDAGKSQRLGAKTRLQAIQEIIDESEGKVLVFAPFREAIIYIADELQKKYRVGVIHGEVAKGDRDYVFHGFQNGDTYDVIVAHPRTMSHGLNLTAATTTIWAGPTPSLETYLQANARMRRPGQTMKMNVVMLVGSKAENKVYRKLKGRETAQSVLLEMLEEDAA